MCPSAPTAGVGTLWNCQDIPMVGGIPLWACGRSATGRLRMLSKWLFGSMISRSTPSGKIYLAATTYYIRPPPNFEGYPSWLVCPLLPIEVAEDFELIVIIWNRLSSLHRLESPLCFGWKTSHGRLPPCDRQAAIILGSLA